MAREKILHCKAMGAEVVLTRSDVGRGHPIIIKTSPRPSLRVHPARSSSTNSPIPPIHKRTRRRLAQNLSPDAGSVDAVVVGVGSGGTLTGIGRFMAKNSPATRMVLADQAGLVLRPWSDWGVAQSGKLGGGGDRRGFCTAQCGFSLVHKAYAISDPDSFAAAGDLLRHEGVLADPPPEPCSPRHCGIAASKASRSGW